MTWLDFGTCAKEPVALRIRADARREYLKTLATVHPARSGWTGGSKLAADRLGRYWSEGQFWYRTRTTRSPARRPESQNAFARPRLRTGEKTLWGNRVWRDW